MHLPKIWTPLKRLFTFEDHLYVRGTVEMILRYSDQHPNKKLVGEVYRYHELGHNLVVIRGRHTIAGLLGGVTVPGGDPGYAEAGGYVPRYISLGTDDTAEANGDTVLGSPVTNPVLGNSCHPIDSVTFPAYAEKEVTFVRMFAAGEPTGTTLSLREAGLHITAPNIGSPTEHYLFARKTFGVITKSPAFTLEARWTIEP